MKNRMRSSLYAIATVALAALMISCNPAKAYEEEEKSLIASYIAENNINVAPDADGLYYIEQVPGTGELIKPGDSVGVYYTLFFLNGEQVQSNAGTDTPYRLRVGSYEVIEGWSLGLRYMKLGTKAQILLPSGLAYGPMGFGYFDYYGNYYSVIPGYTPLLYQMQVVELVRARK